MISQFELMVQENKIVDVRFGFVIIDIYEQDLKGGYKFSHQVSHLLSKPEHKILRKYFRC